jgi:RNA polymerase sigma factor (sigma-70 family)
VAGEAGLGGDRGGRFPTTHLSAVEGAACADPALRSRSLEILITAYWKPVYKYIRVKWSKPHEDARDLTQAFFTLAMEKDYFASFNPSLGRFRTFLRTCLDGFLANEDKAARRIKRGCEFIHLPLEFETAEGELVAAEIPSGEDLDRYFDAEWVRHLFELAVDALRAECDERGKQVHFRLFERYDLEDPGASRMTYQDLAAQFGLPATTVTNHLAFARREFRRILLEKLRQITASDEEFRREARYLLGTDPR